MTIHINLYFKWLNVLCVEVWSRSFITQKFQYDFTEKFLKKYQTRVNIMLAGDLPNGISRNLVSLALEDNQHQWQNDVFITSGHATAVPISTRIEIYRVEVTVTSLREHWVYLMICNNDQCNIPDLRRSDAELSPWLFPAGQWRSWTLLSTWDGHHPHTPLTPNKGNRKLYLFILSRLTF